MSHRSLVRRITACVIGFGLAFVPLSPATASSQAIAITVSQGRAWVNGAAIESDATLYTGEHVRLEGKSRATLFVPGGVVLVGDGTDFRVEQGGLLLERGTLQLYQNNLSPFVIDNSLFHARLELDSQSRASATFMASDSGGSVTAQHGVVDLTTSVNAAVHRVLPGQQAQLGDQARQVAATSTSAGSVKGLVAPVGIDRGSLHFDAQLHSMVYWNDLLRSGPSGRARIALNDGSRLSLGADSSLRVLQHDAAAQQTVLDLAAGRMHGQVVKLTRPGAKFEIRTPSAVAGIVGTDFYLYVTPDYTELIVFEGVVRLTSTATSQAVSVTARMKVVIHRTGLVEGPSPVGAQEIAEARSATNIGEGPDDGLVIVAATGATVLGLSVGVRSKSTSPFTLGLPSNSTKPVK